MRFAVASVPHTGHIFTTELLGEGIRQLRVPKASPPPIGSYFMFAHVYADMMPMIRWWCRKFPVISPMRHPLRVAESYIVRGEQVSDLIENFRRLIALDAEFDLLYLPMDTKDRNERLERISDRLGKKYQTDWSPKNSRGIKAKLKARDRKRVSSFIREQRAFFDRFGYEATG